MREPREIGRLLEQERYDQYAVSDATRFPHCIPPSAKEAVLARVAGNQLPPLSPVPTTKDMSVATYLRGKKRIDSRRGENGLKVAECDNFAVHGLAVLAANASIRQNYNIVKVSSMFAEGVGFMHNHLILVPKDQPLTLFDQNMRGKPTFQRMWGPHLPPGTPENARAGVLPPGSLIVDPWAMGIGNPANQCLAVPPEKFCFAHSLCILSISQGKRRIILMATSHEPLRMGIF